MPIKKRSKLPTEEEANAPQPLVIVAKPKRPMPEGGKVRQVLGEDAPSAAHRAMGTLAKSVNADIDADFTIEDRVILMRSSYDKNNPQEQRYRNRVRNRGTAITAFCITCQGGRKAVTECIATTCPLWAFRFGTDPFYGKKK